MVFSAQRRRPQARHDREVEADGLLLPVRIVEHAGARRLTMRIQPGGRALKVTVPPHVSDAQVDQFIERNRNWVAARVARIPATVAVAVGATIPYLGRGHRIVHLDRLRGVVEVRDIAGEPSLLVPGEPEQAGRKVAHFLKAQARQHLDRAVACHAGALGVRARAIRITDTVSRWGSCSTTRTLSFSWRIVMAPPEVLDYLAAHEVAHLVEMNHSPAFWAVVAELCPQMSRHRAWLRRHGGTLHAITIG
ncbi:MAG: hypothetical protein BroJett030_16770 [Alphaproteobacteria bacterium]|nr:MAG: hypothetical protein BroJett030_16770 [Alphaproteobacteria bacterium]